MKKVFWGVLLAMAGLTSWLMVLLMLLPFGAKIALAANLIAGLGQATGYLLILKGSEELPQTSSWHYAGTFSKMLCGYTVAVTLLQFLDQMSLFHLTLPSIVSTILYYITDLSSFFVMYFCVLGVNELQRVARRDLYADKIYKCFTAWVVVRLLASLISSWLYLVAVAAYVVMLVFYGKAAWAYERRNSGGRW